MKKQKKLTALISSVLMLVFTFATAGASTFAWFTRGTEASATGFDFTASAASGIQVSTDPLDSTSWKSNITLTDFDTTTPGATQENSRLSIPALEPVSTVDSLTNGEFTFYSGTSSNGQWTFAEDTSNFLVFDLYFINSGASDLTLALTSASSVLDGANDEDTSLSTRVGFVIEGSDTDPATAVSLMEGVNTYIWEPNSTTRTLTSASAGAQNSAKYLYNGINNTASGISDTNHYQHVNANASYTAPVTTTKDIAIGDSPVIGTLPGSSEITKIKVYVWMEGQDIDSSNAASEGDVSISLGFDTGSAVTQLNDNTATALNTVATETTLTMTGTTELGVDYDAYVFLSGTDAYDTNLTFEQFLASGSLSYTGTEPNEILLDNEVSALDTYTVVVTATSTGAIGSRTSTPITIS